MINYWNKLPREFVDLLDIFELGLDLFLKIHMAKNTAIGLNTKLTGWSIREKVYKRSKEIIYHSPQPSNLRKFWDTGEGPSHWEGHFITYSDFYRAANTLKPLNAEDYNPCSSEQVSQLTYHVSMGRVQAAKNSREFSLLPKQLLTTANE